MAKKNEVEETKETIVEQPVTAADESVETEDVQLEVEKDVITDIPVSEEEPVKTEVNKDVSGWIPKTCLGKKVKAGEIKDIDSVLDEGMTILEAEIVDALLPGFEHELLMVGQAKGKFGGGQRRVFRQTQKKTTEGNNPSFCCVAVVGDKNGHIGIGRGKSKDTVPAREKAIRKAKLRVMKIRRGCGAWDCGCKTPHSIPFSITGKCGSVELQLMPAPKGKGLVVAKECAKILKLAGITDVRSRVFGQARSTINLVEACADALNNLNKMKITPAMAENVGMISGGVQKNE